MDGPDRSADSGTGGSGSGAGSGHHHHINPGHVLYHDHGADGDDGFAVHDHDDYPPCHIDDGSALDNHGTNYDDYRGADYDGPTVDHSPVVF